ncbi:MAG: Asp-tRNA(Asn)/Glu-tRNA(Gln) amidotransferase subunit GatC, partial [Pseudomonadota bacterium]|nr:Asp-tRNA(Asn)/Glu-tRNA(Gln) amidotransferase subunit GatC [Pseudomonadota bacterium]
FDDADNINLREDRVSDGGYRDKVISNAPMSEDGFFLVPKVVD